VYGGGQSHYTTHDVSVYSNGHSAFNAIHLNDAKRQVQAVEHAAAAHSAALGLAPQVPSAPSRAHMAGQSEDYMRARLGSFLPRRAISRAVNDGASNAAAGAHGHGGEDDDAAHLAEVHERVFHGMTVRTAMDSQFPTCRGDERCAETCVLSARHATDTCMAWLHASPALGGSSGGGGGGGGDSSAPASLACEDAINAARTTCGSEESARCVEPLAAGFHALGVAGGATTDTTTDTTAETDTADAAVEEEDVERHSRSMLNALQRILKEKVMPDAGSAAGDSSAAYVGGEERSWPVPEAHVALSSKGKRNFDLVSTVCRPAGITEQEIAAVCLAQGKWAKGANRVASGWDHTLTPARRKEFSAVTHELMDESDTTDFKCNIPYFELMYSRSAAVEFDVTGGTGGVRCGAVMPDGQKVLYDFFVEARLAQSVRKEAHLTNATDKLYWIFPSNGDRAFRVVDARVKFHAYGKTKKDIEKVEKDWEPKQTASRLTARHFKSGGYAAEVELTVLADDDEVLPKRQLIAAYQLPGSPKVGRCMLPVDSRVKIAWIQRLAL